MLAHRAQLNFQIAYIIKTGLKLEASMTNAATYYFFSSIKDNASLNPPPGTLQLRNEMSIQSHRLARIQGQSCEQLLKVKLQAAAM